MISATSKARTPAGRSPGADVDAGWGGCKTPPVVQGFSAPCPRCGQKAPTVQRGLDATCSACGGRRVPFSGPAVNLAGQPAQFGGKIARFAGWMVLGGGLLSALLLGWLLDGMALLAWVVGSTVGLFSLTVGLLLILGGKHLGKAGVKRERDVRLQAVQAIAARQRGVVTPEDVAPALGMSVAEADALLTELVKQGGDVRLEVDDDGRLLYLFGAAPLPPRVRVAGPAPDAPQRVAPPAAPSEEEEEVAPAARRRARP